jgi:uncharacterized membrane protein
MRSAGSVVTLFSTLMLAEGCAPGPPGLPLGFGPGLDQVVFWAGILVALLLLLPHAEGWMRKRRASDSATAFSSSRQIVAERYAKGEISREEYLRILDDLRRGAA